jgi:hypothetical protein
VFDGHGGRAAADYAREHLLACVVSHPDFPSDVPAALVRRRCRRAARLRVRHVVLAAPTRATRRGWRRAAAAQAAAHARLVTPEALPLCMHAGRLPPRARLPPARACCRTRC